MCLCFLFPFIFNREYTTYITLQLAIFHLTLYPGDLFPLSVLRKMTHELYLILLTVLQ